MTQEKALNILKSGANVFLTGEPGSGKSYTINSFKKWMKEQRIPFAITASTGIASTHIGGVTIHSWSGIGIKEEITDAFILNLVHSKPFVVKKILHPRVLIIDEISMLNGDTLDNIEKIISGVRHTAVLGQAWGGLQVVFVGDFFQLPPVSKFGKETKFAFESRSWEKANLVNCYLTEQHRQSDPVFLEILTAMRQSEVTEDHKKILMQSYAKRDRPLTQLFTHNLDVDRLNDVELSKIRKDPKTYTMHENGNEYLCSMLKKNCLSPETLVLKVGAVVMLTRNKYDEDTEEVEYVNGTLGKIIGFDGFGPIVKTVEGKTIHVMRAEWSIEENDVKIASISQYPLKLAWAVTIHKSQGMSLDEAFIDLSKAFEYGQGYVAISRVRSMQGLYLDRINKKAFEMHPKVIEADNIFREESDLIENKY